MTGATGWKEAPEGGVELRAGEAHLWLARLPVSAPELARCEALLSSEERERARVPRQRADGERFVAVRGILRRLLGGYLGVGAESVRFRYGEQGKPAVAAGGGAGVRFNVSHAGDVALLAFAMGREVGVDVERIRPVARQARVAERVFAPEAVGAWAALPVEAREEGFFREWTRLEAASKLTGEGVWRTVIRSAHHELEGVCWPEVAPIAGYAAALAVEGEGVRLRSFVWTGHP